MSLFNTFCLMQVTDSISAFANQKFTVFWLPIYLLNITHFNNEACTNDVMAAILVFQNNEVAAMLMYQTNPVRVQFFSYINSFYCSINLYGCLTRECILYFPIPHNALCLPPRFCINYCREMLLGTCTPPKEHFTTIVYAKFGGQTECIMGNWKIENTLYYSAVNKFWSRRPHWESRRQPTFGVPKARAS